MDTKITKDVEKFENIPELEKAVTFFGSARFKEDNFIIKRLKFWHKNVLKMVFVL